MSDNGCEYFKKLRRIFSLKKELFNKVLVSTLCNKMVN